MYTLLFIIISLINKNKNLSVTEIIFCLIQNSFAKKIPRGWVLFTIIVWKCSCMFIYQNHILFKFKIKMCVLIFPISFIENKNCWIHSKIYNTVCFQYIFVNINYQFILLTILKNNNTGWNIFNKRISVVNITL